MKRGITVGGPIISVLLMAVLVAVFFAAGCGGGSETTTTAASTTETTAAPTTDTTEAPSGGASGGEIKFGALIPYTGIAAAAGKQTEEGIKLAISEVGGQVAGKKITLVTEDETDDPAVASAKAKKLIEQDKVQILLGPLLAHTSAAVGPYAGSFPIPEMVFGGAAAPTSKDTFYPGSSIGDAYPVGEFAYDDLKSRKAAIMVMDYLYGQQLAEGFEQAFTAKGGTIVSDQRIPMGTADVAPMFENLKDADLLAIFVVNPTDVAFVKQYRAAGLKMPVVLISNAPQEEPVLQQAMGDDVLGMYGSSWYGPLLDTPENKEFVSKYKAMFGVDPGIGSQPAYTAAALFIKALEQTGGDADAAKVIAAVEAMKDFPTPGGPITLGPGRVATHDQHIFKAEKVDGVIRWVFVKTLTAVPPR